MESSQEYNQVDYEEVLRVMPDSFRENWSNNAEVLIYLAELGSLGLQRLGQEPDRLAEEKSLVLEQTQDLAFRNYKTFIQAADCSHEIFQDFNVIESRLDALLQKLPQFRDKCGEFGQEAQHISTRWRQASSTLAKHPQLLELLEIPQLMDNCVRGGYFDEALELSSYVKRIERKHSDIPLIKSIIKDVMEAVNTMLLQLLSKLRTNIQLPECLKVVGYLRRMDVFNESELRIKFLQTRDAWFDQVINDIDKSDAYEHVIKVIENSRIHLFDITTQYRAIFSDDDPVLLVREDSKNNCAIFHSWIVWKIAWFLSVLERDIAANLGGRIDSVLAQCMYFGLSFSRVNIDFRPLLIPIFQKVTLKKFNSSLDRATLKFEKIMDTYVLSSYTSTTLLQTSMSEESLQPPVALLDFYPMAQYCNDVLNAMNELKLCCSFSMSIEVVNTLTTSLNRIVSNTASMYTKRQHIMNDLEMECFNRFCYMMSSDLIPHFNKCLATIFPPDEMSQVLGISSLEFGKFEYLCKLNIETITKVLQDILPSKIDDDAGLIINIKPPEMQKSTLSLGEKAVEDKISKDGDLSEPVCITASNLENLSETTEANQSITNEQDSIDIKQNTTDIKQDTTDIKQDLTDIKQDMTDIKQDMTDIKQDTTNIHPETTDMEKIVEATEDLKSNTDTIEDTVLSVVDSGVEGTEHSSNDYK